MINLPEQYGYNCKNEYYDFLPNELVYLSELKDRELSLFVNRKGKQEPCLELSFNNLVGKFHLVTSYFIGVDWLIKDKLSVYIEPKKNAENGKQVNFLGMLCSILKEPENYPYLADLLTIDFHKPLIPIKQKEDILSPFLLLRFLFLLRSIVRKGLKRSYYPVERNLNAKIKGKIIVSQNLKQNVMGNNFTRIFCKYDEFGINSEENQILKKAYLFTCRAIFSYKGIDCDEIKKILNSIGPAFYSVSDNVDVAKIKRFKTNPLFQEYEQALKLALLILKRFSYNINKTNNEVILTPPFWIDMSKLFELYVYRHLKKLFPMNGSVIYHQTVGHQELDFLLNGTNRDDELFKMVIDTKYKYKYKDENIYTKDARQVSGYSRLNKVYKLLNITSPQLIDCLIIYPDAEKDYFILNKQELEKNKDNNYANLYKIGIKLPEITTSDT